MVWMVRCRLVRAAPSDGQILPLAQGRIRPYKTADTGTAGAKSTSYRE